MGSLLLFSLVVMADGTEPGLEAEQALTSSEVGTRIFGETEQATGLYLVPWENSRASDIDRPPSLLDAPMVGLNVEEFERYAQWVKARKAYRLWRLNRNNW